MMKYHIHTMRNVHGPKLTAAALCKKIDFNISSQPFIRTDIVVHYCPTQNNACDVF